MSLLMDALKKAERDKKKNKTSGADATQSGDQQAADSTDTVPGQKAQRTDSTQTLSESAAEATQVLPESPGDSTVVMNETPLPPEEPEDKTQTLSSQPPAVDTTQAAGDGDPDEFDDFVDETSPSLSLEPLPDELDEDLPSDATVESTETLEVPEPSDSTQALGTGEQTTQISGAPAAADADQTTAEMTRTDRGADVTDPGSKTETDTVTMQSTTADPETPAFQELSLVDEDMTPPEGREGDDVKLETDATLPSARAVESDLKDYFDASQSIEASKLDIYGTQSGSYRRTAPGEATQVNAQTVFTAIRSPASSRLFKWAVAVVLVLAIALGAAGVFYYYQSPPVRPAPSPMVARGVEALPPSAEPSEVIPIVEAPQAAEETLSGPAGAYSEDVQAADAGPATQPATETPASETADMAPPMEVALSEQSSATAEPTVSDAPVPATPEPDLAAAEPTAAERLGVRAPSGAPAQPATPAAESGPPVQQLARPAAEPGQTQAALVESDGLLVEPGAIRISRAKPATNRVAPALKSAYQAYQQGDAGTAADLYRVALRRQPDNRDAHLGLASLALERGDRQEAFNHYVAVLRNNPNDSVASAAVFAMQSGDSSLVSEAHLKLLLDKEPDAGHLHFALGGLYARQQRWPEAQHAFFKAYTSEPDRPAYVYNLAIALDRMGQHKAALGFYEKALEYNKVDPVRRHVSAVMDRIQALKSVN